jgi:hypothetical protein
MGHDHDNTKDLNVTGHGFHRKPNLVPRANAKSTQLNSYTIFLHSNRKQALLSTLTNGYRLFWLHKRFET